MEELWDEIDDFFEDFWEHLTKKHPSKPKKEKVVLIDGTAKTVRPAYVFAQRVDNMLRIVFGASIIVSAITATFLGFQTLSDLLVFLIDSLIGRIIMLIIGICYFIIGLWKLMHLNDPQS